MARSRATTHGPAEPERLPEPEPDLEPGGPEPYERDTMGDLGPTVTRRWALGRGHRYGLSVSGAVVGTLLITALAFGVGGFNPVGSPEPPKDKPASAEGADAPQDATGGTDVEVGGRDEDRDAGRDAPSDTPSDTPDEPAATDGGAKPDGGDTPDATPPEPTAIELAAHLRDGKVDLEWSACAADAFAFYKVVRSTDEKVTWPKGENDTLVAAIENVAKTALVDAKAPQGRKLWYRVFGLVKVDGELVVRCVSNVDGITTPKPPEPTDKPTPEPATLSLTVVIREGHPKLDWSTCESDRFDYYKVVRSKDATVTWPAGENDVLVAAIGNAAESAYWDKAAPGGKTLYYRVFCVDKTEAGYRVLASSGVKSVKTPAPEPPPDPVTLGFEASLVEGAVRLDWESCGSDGFVYYKVVRSMSSNPSYLPFTDGTELIDVIENAGNSVFEDAAVEPGQTWYYRVQAIGYWGDQKVVLGQTPVLEVTIP